MVKLGEVFVGSA